VQERHAGAGEASMHTLTCFHILDRKITKITVMVA